MQARPVRIDWHVGLPIFASESFLKAVGDEYGWLGGCDASQKVRCILPYTVIKKLMMRLVRFRVETIPVDGILDIQEEKSFLNSAIGFFRSIDADLIIPASNNTIFRTFPDGADAAPYGSYVIDLTQPEEILWRRIHSKVRQNINHARKMGLVIRDDSDHLRAAHELIRTTFKRSKLPFMAFKSFERFIHGLGDNCRILIAEYEGLAQSYIVFAYSSYCAYAIYGGNVPQQLQGATKLLCWEAMLSFKQLGVKQFDFFGTRIHPEIGSKQADLCAFKKRFGAQLKTGYMWKYSLNRKKYALYAVLRRIRSGGDIVDAERHKLAEFMAEIKAK
ncbi:hypothetical protein EH223_15935 [candidate division KSB1 bacterium]|nr:hypothetical protein [candidate division KSB1 bacterium]RQW01185.1 MAG: hypothetical protein EH223_15935 [candidate division KSB1 bacterium]